MPELVCHLKKVQAGCSEEQFKRLACCTNERAGQERCGSSEQSWHLPQPAGGFGEALPWLASRLITSEKRLA